MKFEDLNMKELIENKNCIDEYAANLGIVFEEIAPGETKARMEFKRSHINPLGSVHGGALFSLADIVSGTAASADGTKVTTLSSNMNYLAPALPERTKLLHAHAQMKKNGKTIRVMEVEITDDEERLIASATFTFFAMRK